MVLGWDIIRSLQGGVLVMLCFFAPGCLTESMMVLGAWLVFLHFSNFVSKQHHLKEARTPLEQSLCSGL